LQIFNSIGRVEGDSRHVTVSLVRTCRRWNVLLSDVRNLRMLKNLRIPKAFRWCKSRSVAGKGSGAAHETPSDLDVRQYALFAPGMLQFGNYDLWKSDVSFISSQLELYPRVEILSFIKDESG
ncbi:hypothetical protein PFISCL1PPCAC_18144, partial [Pristionchus fissidentatus]